MKNWLADVPVLGLLLFKLCRRGNSSVVYPEWRWKRCSDARESRPFWSEVAQAMDEDDVAYWAAREAEVDRQGTTE